MFEVAFSFYSVDKRFASKRTEDQIQSGCSFIRRQEAPSFAGASELIPGQEGGVVRAWPSRPSLPLTGMSHQSRQGTSVCSRSSSGSSSLSLSGTGRLSRFSCVLRPLAPPLWLLSSLTVLTCVVCRASWWRLYLEFLVGLASNTRQSWKKAGLGALRVWVSHLCLCCAIAAGPWVSRSNECARVCQGQVLRAVGPSSLVVLW